MKNSVQGLCDERSKFPRDSILSLPLIRRGEYTHKCKDTQGGWMNRVTNESCAERRSDSRVPTPLTCAKISVGSTKKKLKNITYEIILNR